MKFRETFENIKDSKAVDSLMEKISNIQDSKTAEALIDKLNELKDSEIANSISNALKEKIDSFKDTPTGEVFMEKFGNIKESETVENIMEKIKEIAIPTSKEEKIAILTDSGTDIPQKYIDKYNIFVLPLLLNYSDGVYRDGIEINVNEMCDRLPIEIPKTSLPTLTSMEEAYEEIISKGYTKIIAITISSGLSGTFNAMRIVADEYKRKIETFLFDTKNIDIGAGFSVIRAGELIEKGYSFDEIKDKLQDAADNTKVFFCLKTLEYLRKGGRIGLVAGAVGSALKIMPVMSCNEDGVYYVVKKARGRKKSLTTALSEAIEYSKKYNSYNVAVVNVQASDEAREIENSIRDVFPNVKEIFLSAISPALAVHTGPGLIGVGVQKID